LVYLKLGGSLLTDKTRVEALRSDVLNRLAMEIKEAIVNRPNMRLLLGHGSGSFGHVAAARFDTRAGVATAQEWMAFVRVSDAAARLNRAVCAALLEAGVPVVSLQPSASALCEDGKIVSLASSPIVRAIQAGILPVVYGDVAFDSVRGGTIISTEEILSYVATKMPPSRLLLAGETDGVLDEHGESIQEITAHSLPEISASLGESRGTDVTGGMASKVQGMLDLAARIEGLSVHVFSGLRDGAVRDALLDRGQPGGTLIR
jgi:isopentenyl phosphate kinase